MTPKEYLSQAKFLDAKINHHIRRKEELHRLACSLSSPTLEMDKVQTSPSNEAPYVRSLMKVMEMEEKIDEEIDLLVALKEQIDHVINQVIDEKESMVLRLHYLEGLSLKRISEEMFSAERTVKLWHKRALSHVVLPDDMIII